MKTIEILSDIRDASGVYFKGETRVVPVEIAHYFAMQGWARAADLPAGTPDLSPKTLAVDAGRHGHAATNPSE
jgi:hypothetical protein